MCYVSLQSQRAVKARLVTLGKLFFFLGSIIEIYNKYNKCLSLKCYLYFLTDSEKQTLCKCIASDERNIWPGESWATCKVTSSTILVHGPIKYMYMHVCNIYKWGMPLCTWFFSLVPIESILTYLSRFTASGNKIRADEQKKKEKAAKEEQKKAYGAVLQLKQRQRAEVPSCYNTL